MINRMISAMKNDLTVYKLLKEGSSLELQTRRLEPTFQRIAQPHIDLF